MTSKQPALRTWAASLMVGRQGVAPPNVDQSALLAFARDEGVDALLASCALPPELQPTFRDLARACAAWELARQAEAGRVLSALEDAGVRALVLKGTALAYWLFAMPSHRPRGDFDLLVEDQAVAERATVALQGWGYRIVVCGVDDVAGFETALERTTPSGGLHRIDLHWRLLNNATLARGFDFEELWRAGQPLERLHAHGRGLGRVHALAHALLHRVTNMPSGQQDRLIWLYDIHLLAGGCTPDEWRAFLHVCTTKAIAAPCLDGLLACEATLGTAVPPEVRQSLELARAAESWRLSDVDGGALDRSHLAALPWRDKVGWLRRKLFPSPAFMRYRYGARGWLGLSRAYLGRWWVGITRAVGAMTKESSKT